MRTSVRSAVLMLVTAALLVPALTLTTLRLWQPGWGPAVWAVAFTPYALPMYAVALALLVGYAVRTRRAASWVAVAAVLGLLALHASWLAPQLVGDRPTAAADATPVRVLTANVWHGQVGGGRVVRAGRVEEADVLVLEEVRPKELGVMDNFGIADTWPYRAGTTSVELSGTMVFSRYPLRDIEQLPTRLGCWRVTVDTPDGPWRLLAVHASSPVGPSAWADDHATILAAAGEADLVVGDLNATADHRPLQRLADAGFRDAAEMTNAGWQPTWPRTGAYRLLGLPVPPLVQIDHVLLRPRLVATRTETVVLDGSDHLGVVADVATAANAGSG